MAGLYIHIPFCKQACSYCDFHFSTRSQERNQILGAMQNEISQRSAYLKETQLSSVYFGGGTPSLLSNEDLEQLFEAVSKEFVWDKSAELTLEANPDDITETKLRKWKEQGINRLSIGLQSFNDEELRWMNRAHNSMESVQSVKRAQDAGFPNLSIDLIYGSKFQTLKSWEKTLNQAITLNSTHISAYNLTIEQKTALGVKHRKGLEPAVDDYLSEDMFLLMRKMLLEAGYEHYEISNFAKPGFRAVHNSSYWKQEHYLGIGPSAHSYNGHSRQWNFANNTLYKNALEKGDPHFEMEVLNHKDLYNEYVLTRLRTVWGCDVAEIKHRFGEETAAHFNTLVQTKSEWMQEKNGVYTLTEKGLLKADALASDLFVT